MKKNPHAVLFDLDGTLLDTANDLGAALNDLLALYAKPPLALADIRPCAGRGSRGLIKLGFNIDDCDHRFPELSQQFMRFYENHMLRTTQLFVGMDEVLITLEQNNIPWGIVTNKPKQFSIELIRHLQLHDRAVCLISGDSLEKRKPHPEPILHACDMLKRDPANCIYIGDSEIDVIASKAAGTSTLVALYGYIPKEENPLLWQADGFVNKPEDILQWI